MPAKAWATPLAWYQDLVICTSHFIEILSYQRNVWKFRSHTSATLFKSLLPFLGISNTSLVSILQQIYASLVCSLLFVRWRVFVCQCWSPLINCVLWSVKWTDHHGAHGMYLCVVHTNNLLPHLPKLVVAPSAALSTAGQNKGMLRGHKHRAFFSLFDWSSLLSNKSTTRFVPQSTHSRIPSHSCTHTVASGESEPAHSLS
jgi:hypothetical protein